MITSKIKNSNLCTYMNIDFTRENGMYRYVHVHHVHNNNNRYKKSMYVCTLYVHTYQNP